MSSKKTMNLKLSVWRQKNRNEAGRFEDIEAKNISPDMSFLEMLDFVNEDLIKAGRDPIEFDSDCREGICGTCGMMINGQAHGPLTGVTACQLHMRSFHDGEHITIEPWRAKAFPVLRDLVVDRGSLDRIIAAGGYTSAKTGPHADANVHLVPKPSADAAFDFAACIGCGACVAACPNASAALFTGAKISQLSLLPQGQVEAGRRVQRMVNQMDKEGFGNCTNIGECRAACPKEISIDAISRMRREYLKASLALDGHAPSNSKGGD
jgi:succinate dehydrogenase / fumarate reductase iron-sulfur subunit